MKKLFIVLALAFSTFAANSNYNGFLDTSNITSFCSDSLRFSRVFSLIYEGAKVVCMANDTDSDGLTSDSIKIQWGYQTGMPILDSAGSLDTLWDDRITLDTMDVDSFGVANVGKVSTASVVTRYTSGVDTSSVTGLACQDIKLPLDWDTIIRFWAKGLSGNNVSSNLILRFDFKQRLYQNTRNK